MSTIALLLAIIAIMLGFKFPLLAFALAALAFVIIVVLLAKNPKKISYYLVLLTAIFAFLINGVKIIDKNVFKVHTPSWQILPSSTDFYIGPNYQSRGTNFNFDSLMLSPEELSNLNLIEQDTEGVPPDAPLF